MGIHRWPVDSPHKGQWRRALMFSLICAWTNGWANTRDAGDLRRHRPHYYVTAMSVGNLALLVIPLTNAFGEYRWFSLWTFMLLWNVDHNWFIPSMARLWRQLTTANNVTHTSAVWLGVSVCFPVSPNRRQRDQHSPSLSRVKGMICNGVCMQSDGT